MKGLHSGRLKAMTTLLLATRNAHKVQEIRPILGAAFAGHALDDFPGAPPVKEDADTFAGNAAKKALELARWLRSRPRSPGGRLPDFVLADDSGLEVDALGGAPGVHSARFAALDPAGDGNTPDADNNARLLKLLKPVPVEKRTARFRCVLALVPVEKPGEPHYFEGVCEGRIDFAPHGRGGFGYDPLFIPAGRTESFAELGETVKNQLSHRAKALAQLKAWFAEVKS